MARLVGENIIMKFEKLEISQTKVNWEYNEKIIEIIKDKIKDVKCVEEEDLVLIIYEEKDKIYPLLMGINFDGTERFAFQSMDEFGVSDFTVQHRIKLPVIGWIKENGDYIDYYFSINPQNGKLTKQGRAY